MRVRFLPVLALAAPLAHADILSTFDADAEGWRAANVSVATFLPTESPKPATWNAATHDIGASESLFADSGAFVLLALSKFLGDLSLYRGGAVSFRLNDATSDPGLVQPNLLLVGLDTATGNNLAIGFPTHAPAPSGTVYSIPLVRTGWITSSGALVSQAQFDSVLGHVLGFGIDADWTSNATDVATLDDVRVAATAVPEPATLMALAATALLLGRRRAADPLTIRLPFPRFTICGAPLR